LDSLTVDLVNPKYCTFELIVDIYPFMINYLCMYGFHSILNAEVYICSSGIKRGELCFI